VNAIGILAELRVRGVELHVEGAKLRFRCPHGVLTPELRQLATTNRAEILSLLVPASATAPRRFAGWVRFRRWGWQRMVEPRYEWWAREDLADYVAELGEVVLEAVVLPEGVDPRQVHGAA